MPNFNEKDYQGRGEGGQFGGGTSGKTPKEDEIERRHQGDAEDAHSHEKNRGSDVDVQILPVSDDVKVELSLAKEKNELKLNGDGTITVYRGIGEWHGPSYSDVPTIIAEMSEQYGHLGRWWSPSRSVAEHYGNAGDDSGAVIAVRVPLSSLSSNANASGVHTTADVGSLVESVHVRKGGKWVELPEKAGVVKLGPVPEKPAEPLYKPDTAASKISSNLAASAVSQPNHLQAINDLHEGFNLHSYQSIHQQVQDLGKQLSVPQAQKLAKDFGINRTLGSKKEAMEAIAAKISDRKASYDRTAEIGAKPQPKDAGTTLPQSVSPTLPDKVKPRDLDAESKLAERRKKKAEEKSAKLFYVSSCQAMNKANFGSKQCQGRQARGRFGSGKCSTGKEGGESKQKRKPVSTSPTKPSGSSQEPRGKPQASQKPSSSPDSARSNPGASRPSNMQMVHNRKDEIHSALESSRIKHTQDNTPDVTNKDGASDIKTEPFRRWTQSQVSEALAAKKPVPGHALAEHYKVAEKQGYKRQADAAIASHKAANKPAHEISGQIKNLADKHGLQHDEVAPGVHRFTGTKASGSFEVKVSDDSQPKLPTYSSAGVHISTAMHPEAVKELLAEAATKAEALGAGIYLRGKTNDRISSELNLAKAGGNKSSVRSQESISKASQHFSAMRDNPTQANIAAFAAHVQTMHPEDALQFAKEHGLRGKTGETLAKEAHIAAQSRSKWQQEARKEGISVSHFKRAAKDIRSEHNANVEKENMLIDDKMAARVRVLNNSGKDSASIQGFDEHAERIALGNPEKFHGLVVENHETGGWMIDPDSGGAVTDKVWSMYVQGKQKLMTKEEAFQQAFNKLKEMKDSGQYRRVKARKQPSFEESVPF